MPRADLLALTPDDLAALTNRGTVKRAERELEAAEVTGELQEAEDGTVAAKWSDGVQCVLPGGKVVADGRCSCPATGLCRHVIRTVFAYLRQAPAPQAAEESAGEWNPGDVTDESLARLFKPAVLTQARTQFENGLLVEVVKGRKPTARFHNFACTLRFQVPGDARYIHCDCAADPPCVHVPMAVWAFRRLPTEQNAAMVSTQERPLPVPAEELEQVEQVLLDGAEFGLSGSGGAWRDRLARAEARCRDVGLVWPAEVLLQIIHQFERYAERDASFDPGAYADLVGELLVRSDAIRNDTGAVPQLLVRGSASDHWTDLASSRFIGLGCGAKHGRRSARLTAYLQDANSGSMVAVSREFPDPPADASQAPKAFWQLAQTPVVKGASFAQVGAGQLLTQGGKRATNHELVLGRAKATVNPQGYAWESLRPPVLAESFAEVRDRLRLLPPTALRPRRVAEDFHVCQVSEADGTTFLPSTQTVQAIIRDSRGDAALIRHPYTSRGGEGAERLLALLATSGPKVRFVAGPMRITADGLCVEPVAVVFEDGGRTAVQPWIDRRSDTAGTDAPTAVGSAPDDPVESVVRELRDCVSELLVVGLRRADACVLKMWQGLERRAEALSLGRLTSFIGPVVGGLAQKAHAVDWDWKPTGRALLAAALLSRMAQESLR